MLNWVSNCKNELVDSESASSRVNTQLEEGYLEAYQEYQRRLTAANALDFDDLIMTTVHLMQAFPEVPSSTGGGSGTSWSMSTRTPTWPSTP